MATPTDAAADAAELARESVGMPQLDPSTYANQLFWLVVALVVIWWILARVALPRIGAVLAERSGTISNDLAAAEELSLKVKEADAAYAKALAAARADAARIVAEAQAAIKADLARATAEADARIAGRAAESEAAIAAIRASSEDAIRTVARDAAHEIATTLGAAEPAAGAIDALVDARMKG